MRSAEAIASSICARAVSAIPKATSSRSTPQSTDARIYRIRREVGFVESGNRRLEVL